MRNIRRFWVAEEALALVEFAFTFPLLMLLLVVGLEISREMIITQRTEKAGYVIADITSQYLPASSTGGGNELTLNQLTTNVFPQLTRIMGSYSNPAKQSVIITSVRRDGGTKRIRWQAAGGGTLNKDVTSVVNGIAPGAINSGVRNTPTSFPAEVEANLAGMLPGENLIVAEVFFFYEPLWDKVIRSMQLNTGTGIGRIFAKPHTLTKRMYFRPRNGDLPDLPPTFPVGG